MPANKSVLMLPGDGIGPEVMEQVRRVMGWFEQKEAARTDDNIWRGEYGGILSLRRRAVGASARWRCTMSE